MISRAAALLLCAAMLAGGCARRSALPAALSDAEFRALVEGLSEPGGAFGLSDNLVSNEPRVAENARRIRAGGGGAYIGVGPEQNFTYIARARPAIAFVIDIRRENRNLHLLYKALFEIAGDRPEFVSRLFSRPRPADLGSNASADALFDRIGRVPPSADLLAQTTGVVRDRLVRTHAVPLTESDLDGIARVLQAFYDTGPEIHFWGSQAVDKDTRRPPYRQLMTTTDMTGQTRSFLASDDAFHFVKALQARNLIVPVVGDFGGPGVIRRVGQYVGERGSLVRTFYASNVAVYLTRDKLRAYCGHLAALPVARDAAFVESDRVRPFGAKLAECGGAPKRP